MIVSGFGFYPDTHCQQYQEKTQKQSGVGSGGAERERANATEFGGEAHLIWSRETFGSCGLCKCFPSVQTHCSQSSDSGQMFQIFQKMFCTIQ